MNVRLTVKRKTAKKAKYREMVAQKTALFAETVRDEMREIVRSHGTTTQRHLKIGVVKVSDFEYAVGANDLGLYYLNYGNGGRSHIITPAWSKAMLFVYKNQIMLKGAVHGYDGIDFIGQVKRRHR